MKKMEKLIVRTLLTTTILVSFSALAEEPKPFEPNSITEDSFSGRAMKTAEAERKNFLDIREQRTIGGDGTVYQRMEDIARQVEARAYDEDLDNDEYKILTLAKAATVSEYNYNASLANPAPISEAETTASSQAAEAIKNVNASKTSEELGQLQQEIPSTETTEGSADAGSQSDTGTNPDADETPISDSSDKTGTESDTSTSYSTQEPTATRSPTEATPSVFVPPTMLNPEQMVNDLFESRKDDVLPAIVEALDTGIMALDENQCLAEQPEVNRVLSPVLEEINNQFDANREKVNNLVRNLSNESFDDSLNTNISKAYNDIEEKRESALNEAKTKFMKAAYSKGVEDLVASESPKWIEFQQEKINHLKKIAIEAKEAANRAKAEEEARLAKETLRRMKETDFVKKIAEERSRLRAEKSNNNVHHLEARKRGKDNIPPKRTANPVSLEEIDLQYKTILDRIKGITTKAKDFTQNDYTEAQFTNAINEIGTYAILFQGKNEEPEIRLSAFDNLFKTSTNALIN
jgi:hypothetical protein